MELPYVYDREHKVNIQVHTSDTGEPCRYFILNDVHSKLPAAYLSLKHDLAECESILSLLKSMIEDKTILYQIKSALFFSAVILYARCYNKADGRGVMLQKDVFNGQDPSLIRSHSEVMTLRNQYIAHAGNSKHENRTMVLYFHPGKNGYNKMEPKVGVNKHQFEHNLDKYFAVVAASQEYVDNRLKTILTKYSKHLSGLNMNEIYPKSKIPDPSKFF